MKYNFDQVTDRSHTDATKWYVVQETLDIPDDALVDRGYGFRGFRSDPGCAEKSAWNARLTDIRNAVRFIRRSWRTGLTDAINTVRIRK